MGPMAVMSPRMRTVQSGCGGKETVGGRRTAHTAPKVGGIAVATLCLFAHVVMWDANMCVRQLFACVCLMQQLHDVFASCVCLIQYILKLKDWSGMRAW